MPSGTSLVNKTFGSLTVLRETAVEDIYVCRCTCGKEVELFRSQLTKAVVRHCGCKKRNRDLVEYRRYPLRYKHFRQYNTRSGHRRRRCSSEYLTYQAMINRCFYKTTDHYPTHGARGITVCPRWRTGQQHGQGFRDFLDDVGPRPVGKTLDRINVNGHYEPGNVKWSDAKEQGHNRRYVLEANGEELPPVVPMELDDEALLAGSF